MDLQALSALSERFTHHGEIRAASESLRAKVLAETFDKQVQVILCPDRLNAVRNPRRAGKTSTIAPLLVVDSIDTGELGQFWAISHGRAKELLWEPMMQLCARHGVAPRTNETELSIKWPWSDRAFTRFKGADKAKETDKKRGDRLGVAAVDETQLMDAWLEKLIDGVLEPATADVRGRIFLFGTPGYVCKGYWHDVSPNDASKVRKGWRLHHWHTRENKAMPGIWPEFLEMKERKGWADSHPVWQREYLGLWVDDPEALVYHYDAARNGMEALPRASGWAYVLGVDLGSGGGNDPMAAHVWGWCPSLPELYEVRSWKGTDATTTRELMAVVNQWREELGGFVGQVIDTGGGGKLTANDLHDRYGLLFEAAQKTEKHRHIAMLNDDLEQGRVKVMRNGPLASEWASLPKDPDDPTKEHPDYDNHVSDAALYAWRKARHFWHEPTPEQPKRGTREAAAAEAARMEAEEAEALQRQSGAEWWER